MILIATRNCHSKNVLQSGSYDVKFLPLITSHSKLPFTASHINVSHSNDYQEHNFYLTTDKSILYYFIIICNYKILHFGSICFFGKGFSVFYILYSTNPKLTLDFLVCLCYSDTEMFIFMLLTEWKQSFLRLYISNTVRKKI